MKKFTLLFIIFYLASQAVTFAKNDIDPFKQIQTIDISWSVDNPKGKLKIRFIRNEDKSDTTSKPKGFWGKLKSVVNMLLDASDNPPFKVEIVREKEKKD